MIFLFSWNEWMKLQFFCFWYYFVHYSSLISFSEGLSMSFEVIKRAFGVTGTWDTFWFESFLSFLSFLLFFFLFLSPVFSQISLFSKLRKLNFLSLLFYHLNLKIFKNYSQFQHFPSPHLEDLNFNLKNFNQINNFLLLFDGLSIKSLPVSEKITKILTVFKFGICNMM